MISPKTSVAFLLMMLVAANAKTSSQALLTQMRAERSSMGGGETPKTLEKFRLESCMKTGKSEAECNALLSKCKNEFKAMISPRFSLTPSHLKMYPKGVSKISTKRGTDSKSLSPNEYGGELASYKTETNVVEDWFNCCNDNRKGYCSGFCSGNKRKASKGLELNCDNAKSDKKAQCEKDNAQCRIKEECIKHNKVWTKNGIAPTSWRLPAGETDDYGGTAKYASRGECISQRNPDDKPKIHSRVWVYGGNYWGQNQWCPGE